MSKDNDVNIPTTRNGSTTGVPFSLAHFDENHNRPTGTRNRARDSFKYTWNDVKSRLCASCASSSKSAESWKKTAVDFPSHTMSYASDTVTFYKTNPSILRKELLSGITVALLQVPESVAFSYVAGLSSIFGLYATVIMSIVTAILGGKPAMISGAAGALAVVQAALTDSDGPLGHLDPEVRVEHVLMSVIIFGSMQIVFGILGLSAFVSLIPNTAMIGFLNGLAIIIFVAQLSTFKKCTVPDLQFELCSAENKIGWMSIGDGETWMVIVIVLLTMVVMIVWPKVPKVGKLVPASLVAVMIGTAFEFGINRPVFGLDTRTVKDTAPIGGSLPTPGWPSLGPNPEWGVIWEYSGNLAAIGLFESIMTLQAVNEITKTKVKISACHAEAFAQGVANLLCGIFRAMGGDAMVGQSTINVINGARYRLSAFVAGVFMLIIILVASPAIDLVPVASLAGVLFMVVLHTFYWPTFGLLLRLHLVDAVAIVLVTSLAVAVNLAVAVIAGIVWQALVSVWENGKLLSVSSENVGSDTKVYKLRGPLTFGSARQFRDFFSVDEDPAVVILDFKDSLVCDFSAVVIIRDVALSYRDVGKKFTVRNLCTRSTKQIARDRAWVVQDHHYEHTDELMKNRTASLTDLGLFQPTEAVLVKDEGIEPQDMLQDIVEAGDIEVDDSQVEDGKDKDY